MAVRGLILWGFKDSDGEPLGVGDVDRALGELTDWTPRCVDPPAPDVRSTSATDEDGESYIATVVARSDIGPHQAAMGPPKWEWKYFRRRGKESAEMHHFELDDMFGRRPRPVVLPRVTLKGLDLRSSLGNCGPVIAKWASLEMALYPSEPAWDFMFPRAFSRVERDGPRIVARAGGQAKAGLFIPSSVVNPILMPTMRRYYARAEIRNEDLSDLPDRLLIYEWKVLAENAMPREGRFELQKDDVHADAAVLLVGWEQDPDLGAPRFPVSLQAGGQF